jgi:hypothetical protein
LSIRRPYGKLWTIAPLQFQRDGAGGQTTAPCAKERQRFKDFV